MRVQRRTVLRSVVPFVIIVLAAAENYTIVHGALAAGHDIHNGSYTIAQAEAFCTSSNVCAGFTFQNATPTPSAVSTVLFKSIIDVNTDSAWRAFIKQTGSTGPAYHGCDTVATGSNHSWCNHTIPHHTRVELLLKAMTLSEKVSLLTPNASISHNTCNDHTLGAPRLGLGHYMWLDETNTAASSACLGPGHCATTFPGPLGVGASFNRSSWNLKGGVLGTEVRALNNIAWHRNAGGTYSEMIGLTGFGPNINNPRDPRFGRLSELPGEDPFHSGQYASAMVRGMQKEDANGHPKMIAFLKHFTACE
jgi:hypothetical protein